MSFAIRRARPDDAPVLLRLIRALAEYEREPDAVVATEADLHGQLASERPPFECLLAEDGDAVGFALFFETYSTWRGRPGIWLEDLFVVPERRGGGIGKALLGRVATLAAERGCARLEWSVLDWNEPAIGFYRRLGAVPLAEWTTWRLDGPALRDMARTTT